MQVTGDLNLNFQVPQTILGISTPGDAAAVTDYWKTDGELRSEYVTQSRWMNQSDADIKRGADAMLGRDPKSVVLNIICGKDPVLLTLVNGKRARYATLPMKPGSYKILPTADAGPSDMTGIVMVTSAGSKPLTQSRARGSSI